MVGVALPLITAGSVAADVDVIVANWPWSDKQIVMVRVDDREMRCEKIPRTVSVLQALFVRLERQDRVCTRSQKQMRRDAVIEQRLRANLQKGGERKRQASTLGKCFSIIASLMKSS